MKVEHCIEVEGLGVSFGSRVILVDVEFTQAPESVTALLGPAGSGKSTLLRTLADLNAANPRFRCWGNVRYAGKKWQSGMPAPRLIQQQARLLHSRVFDALIEVVRPQLSLGVANLRQWCCEKLREFEIPELEKSLDQPIHTLPLVQQRAVSILREAWATPELLMVDEPTADLPDYEAYLLLELLRLVSRQSAVLMATHHQRHAQTLADNMLLLAGGRILEARSMDAFLNGPLTAAGQQFVRTGSCSVASPGARVEDLADDVDPPPPLPAEALAAIAEFLPAEQGQGELDAQSRPSDGSPSVASSASTLSAITSAPVSAVAAPGARPAATSQSTAPAPPPAPSTAPQRVVPNHILLEWNPLEPDPNAVPGSRGPNGFSWLVPGRIAGSPWPGVVHSMDTDLQALKRCGITMLITLTEQNLPQDILMRNGLRNLHLPIYDREPPTVAQTQMLLARMSSLLRKGEVLAVHCLAGIGRTGTILAAWLIREGLTAEEALRRVRAIQAQYVQSEAQETLLHDYEASLLAKLG